MSNHAVIASWWSPLPPTETASPKCPSFDSFDVSPDAAGHASAYACAAAASFTSKRLGAVGAARG